MSIKVTVPVKMSVGVAIAFVLSLILGGSRPIASAQTDEIRTESRTNVRIGVLSLFHPHEFTVTAPVGQALVLRSGEEHITLEPSSGVDVVKIHMSGQEWLWKRGRAPSAAREFPWPAVPTNRLISFRSSWQDQAPISWHPGNPAISNQLGGRSATSIWRLRLRLWSRRRLYLAHPSRRLRRRPSRLALIFVAGGGRHLNFDFCDTTYCQFLREAPLRPVMYKPMPWPAPEDSFLLSFRTLRGNVHSQLQRTYSHAVRSQALFCHLPLLFG